MQNCSKKPRSERNFRNNRFFLPLPVIFISNLKKMFNSIRCLMYEILQLKLYSSSVFTIDVKSTKNGIYKNLEIFR